MRAPRIATPLAGFLAVAALGACSSSTKSTNPPATQAPATTTSTATSTGTSTPHALRVLVTNDDGVGAPGISALVEGLRALPSVSITVVAPADNESGTGNKTTAGSVAVTDAKTAAGYPAKAVHGYPTDVMVWALDKHGVPDKPDVVLSGVNNGQNIGSLIDISGTVAAARTAARRGIPALAIGAGIAPSPDYADGVRAALSWLSEHEAALRSGTADVAVTNINVPSCPRGTPRPVVVVPVANKTANPVPLVSCTGPRGPRPVSDADGFARGYIVETDHVSLVAAA